MALSGKGPMALSGKDPFTLSGKGFIALPSSTHAPASKSLSGDS